MPETYTTPATLVAILWAARQSGDRDLERFTRRELANRYGVEVTIRKPPKAAEPEAAHA